MEKMLVVIFDNEKHAYEGSRALSELDRDGSISIYAEAVIQKNADGTISTKKVESDDFPIRTIAGTALGSLIGLLGGPVGLGIGAATGAYAGMVGDLYVAGLDTDFVADVSAKLTRGKAALLADISEEWVTPVDTRMEALGGFVFRKVKEDFEAEVRAREMAAIRAEITQLQAEEAQALAERKAKIQAKIDDLNAKLQQKREQAQHRLEQTKHETETKLEALNRKAASAHGDLKAALNNRIAEIKHRHEQASTKLRSAAAGVLRKAAASIEKAS